MPFLGSYHVRFACLGNVDQHCSAAGLVEPSRLADKVQLFEVVRCSPRGALLGRRFFDRPHHRHRSVQTEYSHRPAPDLGVVGTPEQVVRGQAISDGFCSGCHSTTSPVTGGFYVGGEDLPAPIGSFVSSNLTPAGQLSRWSDVEIFRAIRNGVDRDGRRLIIMSYTNAGKLSDDDTRAVIAYLRSLPPAGKPTEDPPDRLNLLGVMMLGAGMLPHGWPVSTDVITAPPKGPTLRYGEYLLSYQDCRACHGDKLTGGVPGQGAPLGPDLTVVKGWKFEEFVATMRTGVDSNGHELNRQMPWRPIGRMGDEELMAIYEYLTHMLRS
jgi:mono/diheme cytochrome c family protein